MGNQTRKTAMNSDQSYHGYSWRQDLWVKQKGRCGNTRLCENFEAEVGKSASREDVCKEKKKRKKKSSFLVLRQEVTA